MKHKATIFILAAFALAAIWAIPYENPSGEAVAYAIALRDGGPNPYNPNHLLIEPAIRALYLLVSPGENLDRLTFLLFLARFGLLAYGLFTYALATALFGAGSASLVVALGCLASHAILWFGTDGHPVLFAHLLLLVGGCLHVSAWKSPRAWKHILAGIAYGVSVLVYISNILVVGPVGLACFVGALRARRRESPADARRDRRLLHLALVPLIALVVAFAGTLLAHAMSGTALPLHRWIVTYAGGNSGLSFGGSPLLSVFRAAFGFGNALVGSQGAARLLRFWSEGEESIRPLPGDGLHLVLWAAAILGATGMSLAAASQIRRLQGFRRAVLAVCLTSAVLLVVFNVAWIGSHPHFWVPAIPALWIVWGFAFELMTIRQLIAVSVVVVGLFFHNVFASLRPFRGDLDSKLRRAELLEQTPDDCLVISGGLDWFDGYGSYFVPGHRTLLSLWNLSTKPEFAGHTGDYLAAVEKKIEDAFSKGRRVFVSGVIDEKFPKGIPWREMGPRGFSLVQIQAVLAMYPHRKAFTIRGVDHFELTARGTAPLPMAR